MYISKKYLVVERLIDAQSGPVDGELVPDGGRESLLHGEESLVLHDLNGRVYDVAVVNRVESASARLQLALQLEARLYNFKRVREEDRRRRTEAAQTQLHLQSACRLASYTGSD